MPTSHDSTDALSVSELNIHKPGKQRSKRRYQLANSQPSFFRFEWFKYASGWGATGHNSAVSAVFSMREQSSGDPQGERGVSSSF